MKSFDLGKDSSFGLVLRLAIPAMLGQLVNVLYGIVDRIFIGQIDNIGSLALAGVGVCAPVTTLLTSFSYLIGVGGAPLLSMSLGANDKDKAKKILNNSFLAMLVLSVLVTIITLILLNPLLSLFGATEANFIYAKEYLFIYLIGAPFAIMALGLNQFINCQGFTSVGMKSMIIGAVLNIILDPIFIFVFKMNVSGAAVATVISQFVSFLYTLGFLLSKKTNVKIGFGSYSFKLILKITLMGLSPFIILATDSIVNICLNGAIKRYSDDPDLYLVVATITTSFFQLVTMPLLGISGGTQAALSYNYGAANLERVKECEKKIVMLALIFTTSFFILSFFISKPFCYLFTDDINTINIVRKTTTIFMIGIIPLSFQYCFVDGLTALALPRAAALGSLFRKGLIILSTFIYPIFMGVEGCFYAESISDIIASIFSSVLFLIIFPKVLKRKETSLFHYGDRTVS